MVENASDALGRLKRLERQVGAGALLPDETVEEIRKSLSHISSRVVARAAAFCRDHHREGLVEPLVAAYGRLLNKPLKTDPGCAAKLAIINALRILDYTDVDFYGTALRYRQLEPVWGGEVDAAAELRAEAALAVVRLGLPNVVLELVDLMADEEPAARAGAIRALAASGRIEAEPLLRLKLLTGDERAEVIGECFAGLLAINADNSFDLVAERLKSTLREIRNEAAIAIGESRHPEAFMRLKLAFQSLDEIEDQRAMALAMGLLRSTEAIEYLVSMICIEHEERAVAAIIALAHCRDMEAVEERTRTKANACDSRYVARVFNEEFG